MTDGLQTSFGDWVGGGWAPQACLGATLVQLRKPGRGWPATKGITIRSRNLSFVATNILFLVKVPTVMSHQDS